MQQLSPSREHSTSLSCLVSWDRLIDCWFIDRPVYHHHHSITIITIINIIITILHHHHQARQWRTRSPSQRRLSECLPTLPTNCKRSTSSSYYLKRRKEGVSTLNCTTRLSSSTRRWSVASGRYRVSTAPSDPSERTLVPSIMWASITISKLYVVLLVSNY